MKIKKELIKRSIAGETVLVPCGKAIYDSNGLFILNELGSFLWDRLENAQSEAELLNAILEEYEVSAEEAEEDLHAFMDDLRKLGIISGTAGRSRT